jgi:prephenate dehydrogenase
MLQKRLKVGIVGRGQFSGFIVPHLSKYFQVFVFSGRGDVETEKLELIKSLDYLVLCVPLNGFESVCERWSNVVSKNTVIVDVTSVKLEPIRLMQKYFPEYKILGTHPIFGPQSGKNGIAGLPIVLTNVSLLQDEYSKVKKFFAESLGLNCIEKTAEQHDKEMALVQGLSHFIGRTLKRMGIVDMDTATQSYKQLVSLKDMVGDDSWDLYKTIQEGNPLAKGVRGQFLEELNKLEKELQGDTI